MSFSLNSLVTRRVKVTTGFVGTLTGRPGFRFIMPANLLQYESPHCNYQANYPKNSQQEWGLRIGNLVNGYSRSHQQYGK